MTEEEKRTAKGNIVERLRKPVSVDDPYICTNTEDHPEIRYDLLRSEAADEIERLRDVLDKIAAGYHLGDLPMDTTEYAWFKYGAMRKLAADALEEK
jgi:hypothetical protein